MKATLISHTPDAEDLLIFTKSTRLQMSPTLLDQVRSLPKETKYNEIKYIANTIPSSWEFVDYTFMITGVSRAFTHQFVRSRHGSYAQQTLRMLDVGDGYEYVKSNKIAADPEASQIVDSVNDTIRSAYRKLIDLGHAPEDARGILPTNIATNIVAKFNLRTLSELIKSRSGGRTQDEYRAVAIAMSNEVFRVHPWATLFLYPQGRSYFDDIEQFAQDHLQTAQKNDLLKIVDKMRKDVGQLR